MRIYIIRHGHKASSEPDYPGGANTPLSERGMQQLPYLTDFMAGEELDVIYSSCQLRALQTAQPIQQRTGVDWHVWPVFCEVTRRSWAERLAQSPQLAAQTVAWRTEQAVPTMSEEEAVGLDRTYYLLSSIADRFPGAILSQPFPCPDAWWHIKHAETKETCYARVWLGVTALLTRHEQGQRIAVVCHGGSGDMITSILLGMRPDVRHFSTRTTGVTRLDRRQEGLFRVGYSNRVDHLPQALRI